MKTSVPKRTVERDYSSNYSKVLLKIYSMLNIQFPFVRYNPMKNFWLRAVVMTASGLVFTLCLMRLVSAQQPSAPQVIPGAKYSDLAPEQKALVDDWFRRFSEVVKKPLTAEEGYNNLPVSTKTTFGAVTHALIRTTLTDQNGAVLGPSAITLIERIDTVAGKIEDAGSDQQFRLYVVLKPNALENLARSREFARSPDNVTFHKGYPICFRSRNGVPSLQVSATKDGKRADIDVDYRSNKFPASLVNGHLTAANSDVRAGDNDVLHNQTWSGLSNWWRGFLGLPLFVNSSGGSDAPSSEPAIKGSAKPEVAVHDFLKSWLQDQRPDLAASYFAQSAFWCRELESGKPVDLGVAKFAALTALRDVNNQIGKVAKVSDAIEGVRLTGPRGKLIPQPYESEFMLYDVREDLAERMKCINQVDPSNLTEKAANSKSFGKYVASVFKFKRAGQQTETVAALWAKQNGYWKLISYDIEPEFEKYRVPDTTSADEAASTATPAPAYVEGDKDLIRSATDFLNKWFVLGQPAEAFQYLSPRAFPCANLYRDDDTPAPSGPDEAGKLIKAGMQKLVTIVGPVQKLDKAIHAPAVYHPDVRLVKHSNSSAFVLASVPDHMASAAGCQGRNPGEELYVQEPTAGKVYGNFYAAGFRLRKTIGDSSVLWTVWAKENSQWKVVSYFIMTP